MYESTWVTVVGCRVYSDLRSTAWWHRSGNWWIVMRGALGCLGGSRVSRRAGFPPIGGCILGGSTASFGAGRDDAWCVKLDSAGNVLWQKTYGGANSDSAYAMQATSDSGSTNRAARR